MKSRWTRTCWGVKNAPVDHGEQLTMVNMGVGVTIRPIECSEHWCAVGCLGQHAFSLDVVEGCFLVACCVAWLAVLVVWVVGVVCENCIVDASIFLLVKSFCSSACVLDCVSMCVSGPSCAVLP